MAVNLIIKLPQTKAMVFKKREKEVGGKTERRGKKGERKLGEAD